MIYRNIKPEENEFLKDFLYDAIFIPEGMKAPSRDIIERPELKIYYEDFGTGKADNCIVAEDEGRIIGAVWTRIMDDYGHIDEKTPSLAISVKKDYRGQGIGKKLMSKMIELMRSQGYEKLSLSVQKTNYASKMYTDLGFRILRENEEEEENIMVYEL
ncbi:MAG: GNAT family N-acetyltransferase [Erysipelotrichaceae bacterium]|nr:GNAT family N-acetyltransferase [Erysipelotrichaceae bacterium]